MNWFQEEMNIPSASEIKITKKETQDIREGIVNRIILLVRSRATKSLRRRGYINKKQFKRR